MQRHYRITWIDGKPFLQSCPVQVIGTPAIYPMSDRHIRPGTYEQDGRIERPATEADLKAMYAGRISYDSETEPGRKAWEEHVRRGGD
jgi:hypothetical protein